MFSPMVLRSLLGKRPDGGPDLLPEDMPSNEIEVGDGGERVTPDVPNDVYIAHLSIYYFAARFTPGRVVLDAGCGTGYGSFYLLNEGAATRVESVDISRKAINYCRQHYADPRLQYGVADLTHLEFDPGTFDFVCCSNVLEHVADIDSTLGMLSRLLSQAGVLLLVVPPVVTEQNLQSNFNNPYHLNNFHPVQWHAKVGRFFEQVELYHHGVRPGIRLDFSSGQRSQCTPTDFTFAPVAVDRMKSDLVTTISVVLVATTPRARPLPETELESVFPMEWDIEALWRASEGERRKVFHATGRDAEYDDSALRRKIYPLRAMKRD